MLATPDRRDGLVALMEASGLLQPGDVAALLGVPISTLANWRSSGYGPPYLRVGKYVRYRLVDVEAWIASRVRDPEGVTPGR